MAKTKKNKSIKRVDLHVKKYETEIKQPRQEETRSFADTEVCTEQRDADNIHKAESQSYSILELISLVIGIVAIAYLAYHFRVDIDEFMQNISGNQPVKSFKNDTQSVPLLVSSSKDPKALHASGNYNEAVKMLKPTIKQLITNKQLIRTDEDKGELCKLYFDSILKAGDHQSCVSFAEGQGQAEMFAEFNPDQPMFGIYKLELNTEITKLADYEQVYRDIKNNKYIDYAQSKTASIKDFVKEFENLQRKLKNLPENKKSANKDVGQNIECDLKIAQLKTSLWMLEGGKGTAEFPDGNKDEDGVYHREDALKLAKNYPQIREFWKLRLFIAETVKEQYQNKGVWDTVKTWATTFSRSHVYFDGKVLNDPEEELNKEIKDAKKK